MDDDDFVCTTPVNFLIHLKVKCGDVLHIVYSSSPSYCECCDPNYSKWCMTHWNSNTNYPWIPNKFPLISTRIKDYQSSMEYFEQNGIIYRNKNDKNSLFMACLMFVPIIIVVVVLGMMQYWIFRYLCLEITREEQVEMAQA
jgi:hypothetical protein